MKQDINRYEEHQIFLLKDGTYVFITDVDPLTSLKKSIKERRVYCKIGHKYDKRKSLSNSTVIVEDVTNDIVIAINVLNNMVCTIEELMGMEAMYIGKITNEKIKNYNKILSDVL